MRSLHLLVPALALLMSAHAAAQTSYPDRPIRMIVPLAAASAVDVAARIVTQKMADNMGQQVVILNQPGASGLIGAEVVARAEPDGYTIGGFNDSIMTMVPNLQSRMRWDILKDFEPVSLVATVEWGLIANNQTSYRSAADLIAAAKASPGTIDYGSGGPGSPQHLAMAMFASAAGISLTHVPYRGATQAAVDVAGGQIPVAFQGLGTVTALVQGGQVQLIGVPYVNVLALASFRTPLPSTPAAFARRTRLTPLPASVAGTATLTAVVVVKAASAAMETVPAGGVASVAASGISLWRYHLAVLVRLFALATMPLALVTSCLVVVVSSICVSVALLMNATPRWIAPSAAGPRNLSASGPLSGADFM